MRPRPARGESAKDGATHAGVEDHNQEEAIASPEGTSVAERPEPERLFRSLASARVALNVHTLLREEQGIRQGGCRRAFERPPQ